MAKFKGDLGALVLAVLDSAELHGYEILRRLRQDREDIFAYSEGQLYPLLHRLEEDGLVQARWEERPGKPNRKLYSLTFSGLAQLDKDRKAWTDFAKQMNLILKPSEAN